MSREPVWRRYLRLRGPDAAADANEEVAFHIEARTADLIAAGMAPEQARREALARFGVALGTLGVVVGMRAARALLYGIESTDPAAVALGGAAVIAAALVASFIPARVASRMDAMHTLRQD
jgi:ABC-type lipoprotein release transport system permease subunit